MPKPPTIIPGGLAIDDRGQIASANGFSLERIRRFYVVENFSTSVVRAFHGHLKEEKFVFVVTGSAILVTVPLDDPRKPSRDVVPERFVLSDRQPQVLCVPAGYANGFRPLEPRTRILFFSTATLEESAKDDYRFPHDYWGKGVWTVDSR